MVKFFAGYGSNIAILDISPTNSVAILSSLSTEYPSATFSFQKCDISNWEEQATVFKNVYAKAGSVDLLCANAGVTEIGKFCEQEEEGEEPRKPSLKTVDIDLIGTLYCELKVFMSCAKIQADLKQL